MRTATLAHSWLGAASAAGARVVFFLHGLLGRGSNWQSFAQRLIAARPAWSAVLVDLRVHGDSQAFAPPHTLSAATADVAALIAELAPAASIVVGHSFGGKVALGLSAAAPPSLEQLWVLDASPSARSEREATDTTHSVVEVLSALPDVWPSRNAFTSEIERRGFPKSLGQWLAKNLVRVGSELRFALELGAIRELFADYDRQDYWPLIAASGERPRLHFVLGGRSQSLLPSDRDRLATFAAQRTITLDVLPEATHWLHTDDPEGLLRLILAALD